MNIYVNYETKLMSVDETMHLEKVVIGSSSGSLIQLTDSRSLRLYALFTGSSPRSLISELPAFSTL